MALSLTACLVADPEIEAVRTSFPPVVARVRDRQWPIPGNESALAEQAFNLPMLTGHRDILKRPRLISTPARALMAAGVLITASGLIVWITRIPHPVLAGWLLKELHHPTVWLALIGGVLGTFMNSGNVLPASQLPLKAAALTPMEREGLVAGMLDFVIDPDPEQTIWQRFRARLPFYKPPINRASQLAEPIAELFGKDPDGVKQMIADWLEKQSPENLRQIHLQITNSRETTARAIKQPPLRALEEAQQQLYEAAGALMEGQYQSPSSILGGKYLELKGALPRDSDYKVESWFIHQVIRSINEVHGAYGQEPVLPSELSNLSRLQEPVFEHELDKTREAMSRLERQTGRIHDLQRIFGQISSDPSELLPLVQKILLEFGFTREIKGQTQVWSWDLPYIKTPPLAQKLLDVYITTYRLREKNNQAIAMVTTLSELSDFILQKTELAQEAAITVAEPSATVQRLKRQVDPALLPEPLEALISKYPTGRPEYQDYIVGLLMAARKSSWFRQRRSIDELLALLIRSELATGHRQWLGRARLVAEKSSYCAGVIVEAIEELFKAADPTAVIDQDLIDALPLLFERAPGLKERRNKLRRQQADVQYYRNMKEQQEREADAILSSVKAIREMSIPLTEKPLPPEVQHHYDALKTNPIEPNRAAAELGIPISPGSGPTESQPGSEIHGKQLRRSV